MIRTILLCAFAFTMTACAGFFDKDNTPPPTPLTQYQAEVTPKQLWGVRTGSGTNGEYLKLLPANTPNTLYTSSADGVVTAIDKASGRVNWQRSTSMPITTGPGADEHVVVVGSNKGKVMALSTLTGQEVWETSLPGNMLAQPAIKNGVVVVKASNGMVFGLSAQNGQQRWTYRQAEPNLILHTASAPAARHNSVLLGFANGNLVKLNINSGRLAWEQRIAIPQGAFAIQRMVDLDADPIIFEHRIFAATYQGNIASLDWNNGRTLWTHDISSYTGMAADSNNVFITDAKSDIWAFNDSGLVNWRQTQLAARNTTGPAVMGEYVVVGDGEGYLHWLSKRDGHFAGRVFVGSGLISAPIVENNVVYAYTKNGYLVAYTLA